MSIATEITRLQNAKAGLKTSINAKTDSSHQITNETIDDYASFVDSIQTGGGSEKRLPDEYQEVEYIQSSGTQYINTGYKVDLYRIKTELKTSDITTKGFIFGVNSGSYTNQSYAWYHNTASNEYDWWGYNGNYSTGYKPGRDYGELITRLQIVNTNNYTIDFGNNMVAPSRGLADVKSENNLYIFACNWNSQRLEQPSAFRLHYFKIWKYGSDGIEIERNYVPCYRKADGEIGLYDLVLNEFLTNAGSGTFTKGADHDTPLINLQDKTVTITTNTTTEITADGGYDGLGKVTIITNV